MTATRTASAKAPAETRRCAIYTRTATSAGRDLEFDPLAAQRDACAAYIQRQAGWTLLDTPYADRGCSGANIDRPAFQRLLADIDAGRIDVVVVYHVDRLTRSPLALSKVMARFNAAGTRIVS